MKYQKNYTLTLFFELFTEKKIINAYLGKRAALYHQMMLKNERKWNARLVAALVNEIDNIEISNNTFNKKENYLLLTLNIKYHKYCFIALSIIL